VLARSARFPYSAWLGVARAHLLTAALIVPGALPPIA
jgi:hypothetical protein